MYPEQASHHRFGGREEELVLAKSLLLLSITQQLSTLIFETSLTRS